MSMRGRMNRLANHGNKRLLSDGQGARKRKPHRAMRPRHLRAFRDLKARKP